MKISGSAIKMSAQSTYIEKNAKKEIMNMWIGERPENQPQSGGIKGRNNTDILDISQEAKDLCGKACSGEEMKDLAEKNIDEKDQRKLFLLEKMIESLTGKKIKLRITEKISDILEHTEADIEGVPLEGKAAESPPKAGWGLEYDYEESHFEKEEMTFQAQGKIMTEDGKEIKFSFDVGMSREYFEQNKLQIRAGDAKLVDPLVINFSNSGAELTDRPFDFDINSDGEKERLNSLSSGSGFLALDKNGDGIINNGQELFGPKSGNGFSELVQYDQDGNLWIDENDIIFDSLKIWVKDEDGNDMLYSLKQKDVGAIYLGNTDTPYNLKNKANILQGQVAKTGIYLKENGSVGSVQQVDFVV